MSVRVTRRTAERLCREAGEPAPTEPPSMTYPPRSTVASFEIAGRAVPWSVSRYRGGKRPSLVAWQARVADAARAAMGGRLPHDGPFALWVRFELRPASSMPDLSNCVKALEDAMQGAIYVNDRRAALIDSGMEVTNRDRVCVVVTAL